MVSASESGRSVTVTEQRRPTAEDEGSSDRVTTAGGRSPQPRDVRRPALVVVVAGVTMFVLGGVREHHVLATVGLIVVMVAAEVFFRTSRRDPGSATRPR